MTKKLATLTIIASIGILAFISVSPTIAASGDEASRKEALLTQSGFKVITVTTPKQKQAVNGLAPNRCSAVKSNGKLFYVFPTTAKDKIYVGKQTQFNKYKQALTAAKATQAAR